MSTRIHKLTAEIRVLAQRGFDLVTMTNPREFIEQRLTDIEAEAEALDARTAAVFDVETETLERLGWTYEGDANREHAGWRAPSGRFFELAESQLDSIGPHALECAAAQLIALTASKGGR